MTNAALDDAIVRLNRAVALGKVRGVDAALALETTSAERLWLERQRATLTE
jgi:predicted RNA polymerase sigma factor